MYGVCGVVDVLIVFRASVSLPLEVDGGDCGTLEMDMQLLGPVASLAAAPKGSTRALAGAGAGTSAGAAAGSSDDTGLVMPNLLVVSVGSCRSLKGKDKDDPYVVLKLGGEEAKTDVKEVCPCSPSPTAVCGAV